MSAMSLRAKLSASLLGASASGRATVTKSGSSRTPQAASSLVRAASSFKAPAAPPRLPTEEQAEFERLQRAANTQGPSTTTATTDTTTSTTSGASGASPTLGEVSNLPLRKGAPPEFVGDVNPKTGEVGGPKNEPLRWGGGGDWSYNGRVTDF